jgi:Domain of unknown function (DUF1788)
MTRRGPSVPLPDPLQRIADLIIDYFDHGQATPPYAVYLYDPHDELAVRREARDLQAYLNAHRIDTAPVSLARLFWEAIDESGFFEEIVETERQGPSDPYVAEQVRASLHEILNDEPTLADRVIAVSAEKPERCAVLLYRAGTLYPVFRTSALLDDLRDRLDRPVTLLYPGRLIEPHGLSFMARCEPTHGYRAKIFERGSSR